MLHEGAFSIDKGNDNENELRFLDRHGEEIKAALWPQFAAPVIGGIEVDNARLGLAIDESTAITRWQGERMDYGMVIGALGVG